MLSGKRWGIMSSIMPNICHKIKLNKCLILWKVSSPLYLLGPISVSPPHISVDFVNPSHVDISSHRSTVLLRKTLLDYTYGPEAWFFFYIKYCLCLEFLHVNSSFCKIFSATVVFSTGGGRPWVLHRGAVHCGCHALASHCGIFHCMWHALASPTVIFC